MAFSPFDNEETAMTKINLSTDFAAVISAIAASSAYSFGLTDMPDTPADRPILDGGYGIATIPSDETMGEPIPDDPAGDIDEPGEEPDPVEPVEPEPVEPAPAASRSEADMHGALAAAAFRSAAANLSALEERAIKGGSGLWMDGLAGRSELNAYEAREYGARIGSVHTVDGFSFGTAFTMTDGSVNGASFERADASALTGALFGALRSGDFFAAGALSYGMNRLSDEGVDISVYGASVRAGVDFDVANVTLTPYAGIRWIGMKDDAAASVSTVQIPVGLEAAADYDCAGWRIALKAKAAVAAQTGDNTTSFHGVDTVFAGDYAVEGGAAVEAVKGSFALAAAYDGAAGDESFRDHRFTVTASYRF